jgi:Ca-activated chloride channel family protein
VLAAYQGELRRPATSIYLLDVSGSMRGERIDYLKAALERLTGVDASGLAARYARFQNREHVILIPFSTEPWKPTRFAFDDARYRVGVEQDLRAFIEGLEARGATAIYSTLDVAYKLAHAELANDPNRLVSVVLLTDGMNNKGMDFEDFQARWSGPAGSASEPIRTFPILFGEAGSTELDNIARQSGGRAFDGRNSDLRDVFREIRGYQ